MRGREVLQIGFAQPRSGIVCFPVVWLHEDACWKPELALIFVLTSENAVIWRSLAALLWNAEPKRMRYFAPARLSWKNNYLQ